MRDIMDQLSKKVMTGIILLGISSFASAQSVNDFAWQTSKDVQKVANKKLFEDETLRASHIRAVTLNRNWMVSKGVNNIGESNGVGLGNAASNGIPEWTISKGVQRMQYKKRNAGPVPYKREDQVAPVANE
ncbi:MAG TPA: hypothetical protein VK666_10810 [Chryseolinea sp.]|nr:hypothetical protein [Chryseolinea sp.]